MLVFVEAPTVEHARFSAAARLPVEGVRRRQRDCLLRLVERL